MSVLNDVTSAFVDGSRAILGDDLTGVYLHGSAVMGCFNEAVSDIDLLVVVNGDIPAGVKRRFMDMAVPLNARAGKKGIEFSILGRDVCRPFVYPTPFLLHFSPAHLDWYNADPADYVRRMRGVDADLAAHVTVLRDRGRCLWGAPIDEVFAPVDRAHYLDSILRDIEGAESDIEDDFVYVTLNLCRVLAYLTDGGVLSKREGGCWAIGRVPEVYRGLIDRALSDYASPYPTPFADGRAREFAAFMLDAIRSAIHA